MNNLIHDSYLYIHILSREAQRSWNYLIGYFLDEMGCGYIYNLPLCEGDPAEDNYEDFLNWESSRQVVRKLEYMM